MSERLRLLLRWPADHAGRSLLVLAAVLASVWVALNVGALGEIPQGYFSKEVHREIELEYAAGLLWWCLLAAVLWVVGGEDRPHLLIGWTVKFFVMLVAMLFYEYKYRYNLDAFGYFDAALTGHYYMYQGVDWFRESWIPSLQKTVDVESSTGALAQSAGTENMIRIVMIVSRMTGPSFHALKVVFAFFGFVGIWFVYRGLIALLGHRLLSALYGLMLYPSILFWSSILGKDPLFLLLIGLYVYGGGLWLARSSPVGFAWIVVACAGSYMLRPWMAAIEAVPILVATLVRAFGLWPVVVIGGVGVPLLLFGAGLGGALKFMEAEVLIEELANKAEGQASQTGSSADVDFSEAQALLQSPFGLVIILFSGLFRPLPFDVANIMVGIAALENSILLCMALAALRHLSWARLEHPVLVWASTYSLIWSLLYGLVVLANFGAGMRYKMQMLPFLLMAIFLLMHREGRALLDRTRIHAVPAVSEVRGRHA